MLPALHLSPANVTEIHTHLHKLTTKTPAQAASSPHRYHQHSPEKAKQLQTPPRSLFKPRYTGHLHVYNKLVRDLTRLKSAKRLHTGICTSLYVQLAVAAKVYALWWSLLAEHLLSEKRPCLRLNHPSGVLSHTGSPALFRQDRSLASASPTALRRGRTGWCLTALILNYPNCYLNHSFLLLSKTQQLNQNPSFENPSLNLNTACTKLLNFLTFKYLSVGKLYHRKRAWTDFSQHRH